MRQSAAEQVVNTRNRRVGEFLQALTEGRGTTGLEDGAITRVTIRLPTDGNPETLLVVKGVDEVGEHVAFVGGLDVVQAILTWRAKDGAGGLKWRVDIPWSQRT